MTQVIQSPEAEADLIEIWEYIAQYNEEAADKLIDTINQKAILLANSPYMGQVRSELQPSIRSFPVGKYVLFYRPIENGIELVRIIHGARDIENLF